MRQRERQNPIHILIGRVRQSKTRWLISAAVLLLLVTYLPLAFSPAEAAGFLALPLHSVNEADYHRDLPGTPIPAVEGRIIRDVLRDLAPQDPNIDLRVTAVYDSLLTPIPTSTPQLGETLIVPPAPATSAATDSPTPTQTASPTSTASPTPSATAWPTNTVVYSWPTDTPEAARTATSTGTQPPSPTATATLPPSPTPSATLPPSPTATATLPPSPTATATLPPSPTATATLPPSPTPTATAPVNRAPVISGAANQTTAADALYSFQPEASDPDGDPLVFSISNQPAWATFQPSDGRLAGIPSNLDAGTTSITISASDGALSASLTFQLAVTYQNHPPAISGPADQTVAAEQLYQFTPAVADPDGDPLTFSVANQPGWLMFDPMTGALVGVPTNADVGSTPVTLTVSDGALTANLTFTLTVTRTNHAPALGWIFDHATQADQPYLYVPTASDPDGDPLVFSLAGKPDWVVFDPASGIFYGTPRYADAGLFLITLTVSDGQLSASQSFTLQVSYTNHPPAISGNYIQQVSADSVYHFTPTASDPDGDLLAFAVTNLPAWASFDPATGAVYGLPGNADCGTTLITIHVFDGSATADLTFSLEVLYRNHAPAISGASSQTAAADSPFAFTPSASDPDGDGLLFSVTNRPAWLAFDSATGQLWGTPTNADVGNTSLLLTVSDGTLAVDLPISLTVTYTNHAPTIFGAAALSVAADVPLLFTPTIGDPDGDLLAGSISGQPGWVVFDTQTGSLSGTPSNADAGSSVVTLTVTDGSLSASLTLTLTVTYTNHAPQISGAASQSVAADQLYAFAPTASDPDGDALRYTITGAPGWASFDPATGGLTGTPGNQHAGSSTVEITVSDGALTARLSFLLEVTYTNHAPVIGAIASQSAPADQLYSLTPAVLDPDGDLLFFTVTDKPAWAVFDAVTGTLSGTPNNANAGTVVVTLTVSDGSLSASASFSLTVTYTNHAPSISGPVDQTVASGSLYHFAPAAADADGDLLSFAVSNRPGWLLFDPGDGSLAGTPENADVGSYAITITVFDGALSASFTYSLTVEYTNHAPTITGPAALHAAAGTPFAFTPASADADGDSLTFSIAGKPAWLAFDPSDGSLNGTPDNSQAGTSILTITASDGALSGSYSLTLTVDYTNHAPLIAGSSDQTAAAEQLYSFTPTASDPDGDALIFSIINPPVWAAFDPATGTLSGTPLNADVGSTMVTIRVSDGSLTAQLEFRLTVAPLNHAPTISGPLSQSVNANSLYSFTPTASDPDGDPLSFSITNQPAWASFDPVDGTLRGTPGGGNSGTTSITIHASDGSLTADFVFNLTVVRITDAPVCAAVQPGTFSAAPSRDSYLEFRHPNDTHGPEDRIKVRVDSTDDTKYGVLQFDLSAIPGGTSITKAYLYLNIRNRFAGQTTTLYRLTTGWEEATVTWNNAKAGTPWSQPGGDYASTPYASYSAGTQCVMRLDITELVQGWVSGAYPNFGMILVSAGVDGEATYSAREENAAGERPALVIDY